MGQNSWPSIRYHRWLSLFLGYPTIGNANIGLITPPPQGQFWGWGGRLLIWCYLKKSRLPWFNQKIVPNDSNFLGTSKFIIQSLGYPISFWGICCIQLVGGWSALALALALRYKWWFLWDYSFDKWGFVRTYTRFFSSHNCMALFIIFETNYIYISTYIIVLLCFPRYNYT